MFCFLKLFLLLSSKISDLLQDIEKGNHDDEACEEYCRKYKRYFDQELSECQFKGNESKIQNLLRKVHIHEDGSVTEVQFVNETSNDDKSKIESIANQELTEPKVEQDEPKASDVKTSKKEETKNEGKTSLRTKLKNLFRRK